jgi:imidazoleglycerol phosphate dehydratase HisB
MSQPTRRATLERTTREAQITLSLDLDGSGNTDIRTGLGFFDHMLSAFATHARLDLSLACTGDTHIDDHHTIEDCGLALGAAIDQCLGTRAGVRRFASAYAPLDEALARCVMDLSGRPSAHIYLALTRPNLGQVATENIAHFFVSLANTARCALHLDLIRGENDHHKAEAAFKAFALALRDAISLDPRTPGIPSTKGVL